MKFISLFNDFLFDSNIYESYKSINEVKNLSNFLLKKIALTIYNEYFYLESDVMVIDNLFNDINIKDYPELKEFILSNFIKNIKIYFDKKVINKGGYDETDKTIILHLLSTEIMDKVKPFNKKDESGIYFSIKNDTMIHELQHAYDDYLSDGKFIGKSHQKDIEMRKSIKYLSDEYLKTHLNLTHEINARITVAIYNISFYHEDYREIPDSEDSAYIVYKIKPFEYVKKKFMEKYDGWHHLSDKNKQKILNKLGKYYIELKSYIKDWNDENRIQKF